jgi:hypothetical protein
MSDKFRVVVRRSYLDMCMPKVRRQVLIEFIQHAHIGHSLDGARPPKPVPSALYHTEGKKSSLRQPPVLGCLTLGGRSPWHRRPMVRRRVPDRQTIHTGRLDADCQRGASSGCR